MSGDHDRSGAVSLKPTFESFSLSLSLSFCQVASCSPSRLPIQSLRSAWHSQRHRLSGLLATEANAPLSCSLPIVLVLGFEGIKRAISVWRHVGLTNSIFLTVRIVLSWKVTPRPSSFRSLPSRRLVICSRCAIARFIHARAQRFPWNIVGKPWLNRYETPSAQNQTLDAQPFLIPDVQGRRVGSTPVEREFT